jgi:hypothetical protein
LIAIAIIITRAATLHASGKTHIDSSAQAAETLKLAAGAFAEFIFAFGIVGTGLLAIPVLAGSTAYAIGEGRRWPVRLSRKPKEAVAFYAVLARSVALGVVINFTGVDPIKALYWSAVINGVMAAPVMAIMMLLVRRKSVMGDLVVKGPVDWLGWIADGRHGLLHRRDGHLLHCELGAGPSTDLKLVNDRPQTVRRDIEGRERDRQLEAPRTGASGIKAEHAVNGIDLRDVGVSRYDHINTDRYRIDAKRVKIMQDEDRPLGEPDAFGLGIITGPIARVHVASDRGHRRDAAERRDDLGSADIATMNDMIDALKKALGLGPQQAMRVGYDADPEGHRSMARACPRRLALASRPPTSKAKQGGILRYYHRPSKILLGVPAKCPRPRVAISRILGHGYLGARKGTTQRMRPVGTENLIRVDEAMESPKLAE